jgi:hypothetical protein
MNDESQENIGTGKQKPLLDTSNDEEMNKKQGKNEK